MVLGNFTTSTSQMYITIISAITILYYSVTNFIMRILCSCCSFNSSWQQNRYIFYMI